jgi:hypothetical protein
MNRCDAIWRRCTRNSFETSFGGSVNARKNYTIRPGSRYSYFHSPHSPLHHPRCDHYNGPQPQTPGGWCSDSRIAHIRWARLP